MTVRSIFSSRKSGLAFIFISFCSRFVKFYLQIHQWIPFCIYQYTTYLCQRHRDFKCICTCITCHNSSNVYSPIVWVWIIHHIYTCTIIFTFFQAIHCIISLFIRCCWKLSCIISIIIRAAKSNLNPRQHRSFWIRNTSANRNCWSYGFFCRFWYWCRHCRWYQCFFWGDIRRSLWFNSFLNIRYLCRRFSHLRSLIFLRYILSVLCHLCCIFIFSPFCWHSDFTNIFSFQLLQLLWPFLF